MPVTTCDGFVASRRVPSAHDAPHLLTASAADSSLCRLAGRDETVRSPSGSKNNSRRGPRPFEFRPGPPMPLDAKVHAVSAGGGTVASELQLRARDLGRPGSAPVHCVTSRSGTYSSVARWQGLDPRSAGNLADGPDPASGRLDDSTRPGVRRSTPLRPAGRSALIPTLCRERGDSRSRSQMVSNSVSSRQAGEEPASGGKNGARPRWSGGSGAALPQIGRRWSSRSR